MKFYDGHNRHVFVFFKEDDQWEVRTMELIQSFKSYNMTLDFDFIVWSEEAGSVGKVAWPMLGMYKEEDFLFFNQGNWCCNITSFLE